jgi:hypothetical protein
MPIQITKVRVTSAQVQIDDEGKLLIVGKYDLITDKGTVLAKQSFNDYGGTKFEFDKSTGKDFIDAVESTIEIETGIQEALKTLKEKK